MLHIIHGGSNIDRVAKKESLLNTLQKKGEYMLIKIDGSNFSEETMFEYGGAAGLLGERYIVLIDGALKNAEQQDILVEHAEVVAGSSNIFIFIEEKLTAPILKKLEKKGADIHSCVSRKEESKNEFNIFALADAISERNRKNAWVLLQKAFTNGIAPEEIHGVIFWQIKTLLLVVGGGADATPVSTGLKPYPFQKALRAARNFSEQELKEFIEDLTGMYHMVRIKGGELETGIERFVLSL